MVRAGTPAGPYTPLVPLTATLCLVEHRALAQPILDLLADNGIRSFVDSDDCGGVDPALAFSNGTYVRVAPADLAAARVLLAAYQAAPIDWEAEASKVVAIKPERL